MLSVCSLQSNHKHFFLGRGFSKCLSPSPALRRVGDIATTSCICEGVPPPACDFLRVPTPCYMLEPRGLVVGPESEQSDTQKLVILPPNLKQPLLSLLVSALVQIPAQILLHLVLRCRVQGADRKQSLLSLALIVLAPSALLTPPFFCQLHAQISASELRRCELQMHSHPTGKMQFSPTNHPALLDHYCSVN